MLSSTLAAWPGFAEADPVALGLVVAAVSAMALAYLVNRLRPRRPAVGIDRGARR